MRHKTGERISPPRRGCQPPEPHIRHFTFIPRLNLKPKSSVKFRYAFRFLEDIGLGYLALDRGAPTLSGGEMRRIQLASQLGSGLTGVTYILDEPSIGLHPRDQERLIAALQKLRDIGNSVLVVEHDRDTILASDHVIDFGPKAGKGGGEIIAIGAPDTFTAGTMPIQKAATRSLTQAYLSNAVRNPCSKNST